jgi:hypothetical protein
MAKKRKKRKRLVKVPRGGILDTPEERRQAAVAAWVDKEMQLREKFFKAMSKAVRAWEDWQELQVRMSRALKRYDLECEQSGSERIRNKVKDATLAGAFSQWPKKGE